MRRRLALVATGGMSLVALLTGSAFTEHTTATPVPGRLVAYDLRTGDVRFDVPTVTPSASIYTVAPGVIAVNGAASCRALKARGPLMSAYSSSTGARLWQRPVDAQTACVAAWPASTSRGLVLLANTSGLQGWRASDGSTQWRSRRNAVGVLASPSGIIATEGAPNSNQVDFIDGGTGKVDRSVAVRSGPGPWFATSRTAIVSAHQGTVAPRSRLVALDRASGRQLWQRTLPSGFSAPTGAGGVVIVSWQTVPCYVAEPSQLSTGAATLTTAAFDVRSGHRLWRRITPFADPFRLELFTAGAGLAVFVHDKTVEALDLYTGVTRWREPLATSQADGFDDIVAGGSSVAVVDPTTITVFDARDGSKRWSRPVTQSGIVSRGPAVISRDQLVVPGTSTSFIPYNG
jgi:outer membrane protein assembly factor BamB